MFSNRSEGRSETVTEVEGWEWGNAGVGGREARSEEGQWVELGCPQHLLAGCWPKAGTGQAKVSRSGISNECPLRLHPHKLGLCRMCWSCVALTSSDLGGRPPGLVGWLQELLELWLAR